MMDDGRAKVSMTGEGVWHWNRGKMLQMERDSFFSKSGVSFGGSNTLHCVLSWVGLSRWRGEATPTRASSRRKKGKGAGGEWCADRRMEDLVQACLSGRQIGKESSCPPPPLSSLSLLSSYLLAIFCLRVNCSKYKSSNNLLISKTLILGYFLATTEIKWYREIILLRTFQSIAGISVLSSTDVGGWVVICCRGHPE